MQKLYRKNATEMKLTPDFFRGLIETSMAVQGVKAVNELASRSLVKAQEDNRLAPGSKELLEYVMGETQKLLDKATEGASSQAERALKEATLRFSDDELSSLVQGMKRFPK